MNSAREFELPLCLIREEIAASDLLPEAYARYRLLLADGMRFFLERLSAARLRRILAEQAGMPVATPIAQRVVAVLHHIPALHKLGQVVARDRRLEAGFRERLQELESLEPRTPRAQVVRMLEREFRGWRKAEIELGAAPLAEGSVAVVMPFRWGKHAREGVFKLLKPEIQRLLAEDLKVLGCLGDYLDEDCARYHLAPLDYRETFDTIRELLLHEVRLDEEQEHLREAARLYASAPEVAIPKVFPFCSSALTAMERLYGGRITGEGQGQDLPPERLAYTVAEALVARPMFSSRQAALFHADPHAGNLMLTSDGRLGILDWSLVGRLHKEERIRLTQLLLGALALDAGRMEATLQALALSPLNSGAVRQVLSDSLRQLRWGALPGLGWLTNLLDGLVLQAGVRFDSNLLLFRKSLLTLEGVLADVAGPEEAASHALLDKAALAVFLRQWSAELPTRLCSGLHARSSATHVSNADLLGLLWSAPTAAARWWGETGLECLQAASRVMISTTFSSLRGAAVAKAR